MFDILRAGEAIHERPQLGPLANLGREALWQKQPSSGADAKGSVAVHHSRPPADKHAHGRVLDAPFHAHAHVRIERDSGLLGPVDGSPNRLLVGERLLAYPRDHSHRQDFRLRPEAPGGPLRSSDLGGIR